MLYLKVTILKIAIKNKFIKLNMNNCHMNVNIYRHIYIHTYIMNHCFWLWHNAADETNCGVSSMNRLVWSNLDESMPPPHSPVVYHHA